MEFLRYFITEEVFLVPDTRKSKEESHKNGKNHNHTEAAQDISVKNEKKFPLTIITSTENKEEVELLNKILNAIKLNKSDVQIITDGSTDYQGKKIIAFGGDLLNQLEFYSPAIFEDTPSLKAHSLSDINADVEKKKKLWACLKKMFDV